jgi:hypothetical protein
MPSLAQHLAHLRTPLQPLLSIETGAPHPAFPPTLLHYHLLTEAELDGLAYYYHQRTPSRASLAYPAPVVARWHVGADVAAKRRRFGRFAGLRGCESPTAMAGPGRAAAAADADADAVVVLRWVERWLRERDGRERERQAWRRKGF